MADDGQDDPVYSSRQRSPELLRWLEQEKAEQQAARDRVSAALDAKVRRAVSETFAAQALASKPPPDRRGRSASDRTHALVVAITLYERDVGLTNRPVLADWKLTEEIIAHADRLGYEGARKIDATNSRHRALVGEVRRNLANISSKE